MSSLCTKSGIQSNSDTEAAASPARGRLARFEFDRTRRPPSPPTERHPHCEGRVKPGILGLGGSKAGQMPAVRCVLFHHCFRAQNVSASGVEIEET